MYLVRYDRGKVVIYPSVFKVLTLHRRLVLNLNGLRARKDPELFLLAKKRHNYHDEESTQA